MAWKKFLLLGTAALAAVALVVATRSGPGGRLERGDDPGKALRLNRDRVCLESDLKLNFGKFRATVKVSKGSGTVEVDCPKEASLNSDGKVKMQCMNNGMWKTLDNSCFDCKEQQEHFSYKHNEETLISLLPAQSGTEVEHNCTFKDGTTYDYGKIVFKCVDRTWKHHKTTCSTHRCREGNVTLDFGGKIGMVPVPVESSNGIAKTDCPKHAPRPKGKIGLECGHKGNYSIGQWHFAYQECQDCDPATIELKVDNKYTKRIELPGGLKDDKLEGPDDAKDLGCKFANHTFTHGSIAYECRSTGDGNYQWQFLRSTCRDWICPDQTAMIKMQYELHAGESTVTGTSQIHLKPSSPGEVKKPCPEGAPDPKGDLTFECHNSGHWTLKSVDCGKGVEVTST